MQPRSSTVVKTNADQLLLQTVELEIANESSDHCAVQNSEIHSVQNSAIMVEENISEKELESSMSSSRTTVASSIGKCFKTVYFF